MKTTQIKVDPGKPSSWPKGRLDAARVDSTSARALTRQQASDDAAAMQDAAKYARRVRQRLGLTQQELSQRIDVSLETIRNWEQGKRSPTGAAKALLRVLDRAPEAALGALS
jgi:putative transcriptional regulator